MTDSDDEWIIVDVPTTQVSKPPPIPPRPSPEVIAKLFACSEKKENGKK